jgi:hypothetical protein
MSLGRRFNAIGVETPAYIHPAARRQFGQYYCYELLITRNFFLHTLQITRSLPAWRRPR